MVERQKPEQHMKPLASSRQGQRIKPTQVTSTRQEQRVKSTPHIPTTPEQDVKPVPFISITPEQHIKQSQLQSTIREQRMQPVSLMSSISEQNSTPVSLMTSTEEQRKKPTLIIPNRSKEFPTKVSNLNPFHTGQGIPEDQPLVSTCSPFKGGISTGIQSVSPVFKYFGSSLFKLRNTTTKLKLETRRPSYMEWKEKFVNNDEIKDIGENERGHFHSEFSYENIKNINNALTWVRNELVSTSITQSKP